MDTLERPALMEMVEIMTPLAPLDPIDPYRGKVVDLVNPYLPPAPGLVGANLTRAVGSGSIAAWLEANPGRWALVAENGMGVSAEAMRRLGYLVAQRGPDDDLRSYAQKPHPKAETLREAMARDPDKQLYLPKLERDPFDWTPAELADAAEHARSKLFPLAERRRGRR